MNFVFQPPHLRKAIVGLAIENRTKRNLKVRLEPRELPGMRANVLIIEEPDDTESGLVLPPFDFVSAPIDVSPPGTRRN